MGVKGSNTTEYNSLACFSSNNGFRLILVILSAASLRTRKRFKVIVMCEAVFRAVNALNRYL